MRLKWTPEMLAEAHAYAVQYGHARAAEAMTARWGYNVTHAAICNSLARAGLRIGHQVLRSAGASTPTIPTPSPVRPEPEVEFEITVDHVEVARVERDTRDANRVTRQQRDALLDENDRLRRELESALGIRSHAPEIISYRQPEWARADAVSCALASDWHIEEPVSRASVHGLNEYNLEIARSRAEHFAKHWLRLTDIHARDSKITTMFLGALGDFFSGFIHEELIANTLLAPGDAAKFAKDLLCSVIDYILRESSYIIDGEMLAGNHGRLTHQMHFGDPTGTSLETFLYHAIVDRYHGNPRVVLHVADQAMVYRTFFESFRMRLIHGYEVKYGGGVGGITIPINKAISQWDIGVKSSLTVMGHFHQRFDGGNFLANGSLIGYNLYAQAIKAKFEEATQAFFLIHARGGGEKSVVAPIWLDDAHKG